MNSLKKAMGLINTILDINQNLSKELYLKQLIKNIAKTLNIKYVLIGTANNSLKSVKTKFVYSEDGFLENFTYDLKHTPCEDVLSGHRVCIYDSKVYEHFPKDILLQDMNIESYIGAPIISNDKKRASSILVLLDEKPLLDAELYSSIIEFLALRVHFEIEKINNDKYLQEEVERRTKELELANIKIKDLELKKSEEKFKKLFELSPIGMAMVSQETGEFLEVNESLLNFTGYSKKEFLNLSFWDITPKEYENQEKQQEEDLKLLGRFGPNVKEYIKKDGTRFPIKISGFALEQKDGQKVVWGLIEDITENMQYETLYKDQKHLLEYITFENNLQKILDKIVKLAEKRNPQTRCSILLLDESKQHLIKGSAPSLPVFYNDAVNGVKIGEKVGSCGSAAFLKKRVIVEDINKHENWADFLTLTKKANLHSCWSEPIISTQNEVLGTFAIYNDKASTPSKYELKTIETYANIAAKAIEKYSYIKKTQALSQQQKTLLSLFDKGESTLFMWKSHNWKINFVSGSVKKLLGYDENDFLTNTINYEQCIHKNDLAKFRNEISQARKDKLEHFRHEPYRIITKDKTEKWVLDYKAIQKDKNGEIQYFIAYITDITEQTKSQELIFQQSKVASLGEMLGNIAHQWRQPLSLISTTATGSKLKKELNILSDEEFLENMNNINEKAQYLSKTIDDFRNFFFTDSYNKKVDVDLKITIEKVLSLVNDSLKSSNIQFIKNQDNEDLIISNCNENLLIQALINIINNARDALNILKDKNIDKYIFLELKQKNNKISIQIKDNAGGIDESIFDKIFEPYFTTKHKSQGTGIGLYMTNQIILKHLDAKISAKNIEFEYLNNNYKGACFEIIINNKD